jgi:hypothetical protein
VRGDGILWIRSTSPEPWPGARLDIRVGVGQRDVVRSFVRLTTYFSSAVAVALLGLGCSSSSRISDPVAAAERLATELGIQFDRNGLAPSLARSQSVNSPWYAWDASSGRTSLKTLAGDEMDVSMSFWKGTLGSTLRAARSGDGYCLLTGSGVFGPDGPIAWWVKPSGMPHGKLADASACAAIAPN